LKNTGLSAYHYQSKATKKFDLQEGDMVIQAAQPRSVLLQVLMEEEPILSDSVTYDITAWALPFAYQTDCYAFPVTTKIETIKTLPINAVMQDDNVKAFAYQIPWNDLNGLKCWRLCIKRITKFVWRSRNLRTMERSFRKEV
jgi:hypothetical protein